MDKEKFISTCLLELAIAIEEQVKLFFDDDKSVLFALVAPSDHSNVTNVIGTKQALARLLEAGEITPEHIKEKFCDEIDKALSQWGFHDA